MPDSWRSATGHHADSPSDSSDASACRSDFFHHAALVLPFSFSDSLSMNAACATLPEPISISCSPTITMSARLARFPSHVLRLAWLGCFSFTFQVPARMVSVRRWMRRCSRTCQPELHAMGPPSGTAADQPMMVPLMPIEKTRVPAATSDTIGPRCALQAARRCPLMLYTMMEPSISPAQMSMPTAAMERTPTLTSSSHSSRPLGA
mmetsp:Transcript_18932/g.48601  ORF Transcript_18932/g.48601 Transcript_18932/m.48601 type:complete len:206 (-) Transcript_18932:725-1342(-)